jgi:hypothetical protein
LLIGHGDERVIASFDHIDDKEVFTGDSLDTDIKCAAWLLNRVPLSLDSWEALKDNFGERLAAIFRRSFFLQKGGRAITMGPFDVICEVGEKEFKEYRDRKIQDIQLKFPADSKWLI